MAGVLLIWRVDSRRQRVKWLLKSSLWSACCVGVGPDAKNLEQGVRYGHKLSGFYEKPGIMADG